MEKRFLVIATLVLVAAFFAASFTDPTGEAIRANRLNYQSIEDTDSEIYPSSVQKVADQSTLPESRSSANAQGSQGGSSSPVIQKMCLCPYEGWGVTYTQNDCGRASLATCQTTRCKGKIQQLVAGSSISKPRYIYEPFDEACVVKDVKFACDCPQSYVEGRQRSTTIPNPNYIRGISDASVPPRIPMIVIDYYNCQKTKGCGPTADINNCAASKCTYDCNYSYTNYANAGGPSQYTINPDVACTKERA